MAEYSRVQDSNIITICQGSDYYDEITIKTPNPSSPNDRTQDLPFDLTNYTVTSQLRNLAGELVGTFLCTIDADPTTGKVERYLDKATTSALTPDVTITHIHGIELTDTSDIVLPEIQGGALIEIEIVKVVV